MKASSTSRRASKKETIARRDQILHGANFESEDQDERIPQITEILDKIGEGLREDDATNLQKLNIARKYGPLLLQLKSLSSHGDFMNKLTERFPNINYAKCNRWMTIAKNESDVNSAIEKYPEVAWGPKKMIDYIKGWNPDEEQKDEDEMESSAIDNSLKQESQCPIDGTDAPENDTEEKWYDQEQEEEAKQEQEQEEEVEENVEFEEPELSEIDVEVRIGFKLSVSKNVSVDEVKSSLGFTDNWQVTIIDTTFEYQMSEIGVTVNHVRPW